MKPKARRKPLAPADVLRIYYADPSISTDELAKRYGAHKWRIYKIRQGRSFTKLLAESKTMQLCINCVHAPNGHCLMGFPEAETEGPLFAQDCTIYKRRNQTNG